MRNKNTEANKIEIALIEIINKFEEEDFLVNNDMDNTRESKFNHFWKSFFDIKTTIVIWDLL